MCIYIPTAEKSAITSSVVEGGPRTPATVGKIPSLEDGDKISKFGISVVHEIIM